MKALRILALIALGVSCHLDKLVNGAGSPASPPSHGTPVGLVFSRPPSGPRAGRPIGPVQVSVVDSAGQPVAGVESTTVTIALGSNPGGDTLRGTTATHPTRGVATFSDLSLDRAVSGYTLAATAAGLPTVTSDTFTVVPGPAAQLTFTAEPNGVSQGGVVTPTVVVTAFDSVGNKGTNFTGVVTLTLRQNGSTVDGALSGNSATAVAGVATFGNLQVNNAGTGSYTLTAAFGSATPVAESAPFGVTPPGPPPPPPPGSGPYLLFTDQPAIAQQGQPIPTVRLTVYDASGNQDPSYVGDVTLSIGFNPGGGTLTGGGTVAMHASLGGVAQWEQPSIDRPGAGYTLHATAPGLRETFSDPFDITAAPPPPPNGADGLGFFTQPGTTAAGASIAPVRVAALAPGGVVATAYSGPIWISLAANSTGATLSGTRHLFAVNGFVTFSDLRIDKPGTGYTLRVTAWPLNYKQSVPFDVTP